MSFQAWQNIEVQHGKDLQRGSGAEKGMERGLGGCGLGGEGGGWGWALQTCLMLKAYVFCSHGLATQPSDISSLSSAGPKLAVLPCLLTKCGPSHDMLQHVMFAHVIKKSAVQLSTMMLLVACLT